MNGICRAGCLLRASARIDAAGNPVRFPVPHDDCHAVVSAVREGAAGLGVDPARIAVGGASAGGNLSAGVALRLRDEGTPPWQVLLVYPNLHPGLPERSPEAAEALAGLPLALDFPLPLRDAIHRNYYGDGEVVPYAYAGLAPDLSGFPPTYVEVAKRERTAVDPHQARPAAVGHRRARRVHAHGDGTVRAGVRGVADVEVPLLRGAEGRLPGGLVLGGHLTVGGVRLDEREAGGEGGQEAGRH